MSSKAPQPFVHYDEVSLRELFRETARSQRVCAVCSAGGAFSAHHVIYQQHLRAEHEPLWHPENALRLCTRCHRRHHSRIAPVPLAALLDANIAYAFAIFLQERAIGYLERYYAEVDRRLVCERARAL